MKRLFIMCTLILTVFSCPLFSASNTFLDYQNYNHGYCPDCNCAPCKCGGGNCPAGDPASGTCPTPDPCCPPATSCATECGLNIWVLGIGIAAIATAAVLIIGNNNGRVVHASVTP